MSSAAISLPACQLYVRWRCRRCGFSEGVAKTNIPVNDWNEPMVRALLDTLKQKLVKAHQRQWCIATVEDFVIERHVPHGKDAELL